MPSRIDLNAVRPSAKAFAEVANRHTTSESWEARGATSSSEGEEPSKTIGWLTGRHRLTVMPVAHFESVVSIDQCSSISIVLIIYATISRPITKDEIDHRAQEWRSK